MAQNSGQPFSLNIGEAIQARRVGAGLSARLLAKRAGLNATHVAVIESGVRKAPKIDTVVALARALGCSVDALVIEAEAIARRRSKRSPRH